MKYIVISHELADGVVQEIPVLFPLDLMHSVVAEAIMAKMLQHKAQIVAAGEMTFGSAPMCFGHSTSLNVNSRGPDDAALVYFHDMTHGLERKSP